MAMRILSAPTWVGEGRRCRVVVESDGPLTCQLPAELQLLDRSPEDHPGPQHRLYLKGHSSTDEAHIALASGSNTIELSIEIVAEVDWDIPRSFGPIKTPRVWPLDGRAIALKSEHTVVPLEQIGKSSGSPPECEAMEWSDEFLWDLEPKCDIPRWHWVNLKEGCPVDRLDIFSENPYYPWVKDPVDHRSKVQCPVDLSWYPTNDIDGGDHTSGDFPDDGWGYEQDGHTYGFLAVATLWQIRRVYSTMNQLAARFEATGDQVAVRKLAILFVSLAREHRYLAMAVEHRFQRYEDSIKEFSQLGPDRPIGENYLVGSGMDEYCINMPYNYADGSRAYDLIFDRIDSDGELVAFVSSKLPHLDSGPKIRKFIETFFIHVGIQVSMDGSTTSNLPFPQRGLIALLRSLDQPECKEVVDWAIEGGGALGRFAANYYYKDGAAYESTGGYNGIHVGGLVPLAEDLIAMRAKHPELYSDPKYDPFGGGRYSDILTWPLHIVAAGLICPAIGDFGALPSADKLPPSAIMPLKNEQETYRSAAATFGDNPDFATASQWIDDTRTANQDGDPAPPSPFMWPSRLLDGYGVGLLESGEGEKRRALWLYYGDHPGHAHFQPMDIGLMAHGRNLMRHMGYPYSWNYMDTWDANWLTHYSVHVNSQQRPWWRSTVKLFSDTEGFQVVRASGEGFTADSPYEDLPGHRLDRTVCLVDLPDGRFYAVDFFDVEGGTEHWWSFHGPPGEFSSEGLDTLADQPTGTALGPDVEYGEGNIQPSWGSQRIDSLSHIYNVSRGAIDSQWSASWTLPGDDSIKLRMTQVSPDSGEVVLGTGRSPHAPADNAPYELEWALRHRTGEAPLSSCFVNVVESDSDLPVNFAEMLKAEGVSAVRIETERATQWVLRADTSTAAAKIGDVEFSGQMGMLDVDEQGVRRARLVGDGHLTWKGAGVVRGAPDWRGEISEVDTSGRSLVVLSEEDPPDDAVGQYLLVKRGQDSFAYQIESIRPADDDGGWMISLNWSPLIGEARVSQVDGDRVELDSPLPLAAGRGYYRGAWLLNHDRKITVPIKLATGGPLEHNTESSVTLDLSSEKTDLREAFPPDSDITIEEIAKGDRVWLAGWSSYDRDADGNGVIRSSGPPVAVGSEG